MADLKEILAVMRPATDLSEVTLDTELVRELGIDSLTMMLLTLAIEDKYKVRFPDMQQPPRTVGEVCKKYTVSHYIETNRFYILRRHISTAIYKGICLRCLNHKDSGTWTGTTSYIVLKLLKPVSFRFAGSNNEIKHIILYLVININFISGHSGP